MTTPLDVETLTEADADALTEAQADALAEQPVAWSTIYVDAAEVFVAGIVVGQVA